MKIPGYFKIDINVDHNDIVSLAFSISKIDLNLLLIAPHTFIPPPRSLTS
jgi:hypothetical protein